MRFAGVLLLALVMAGCGYGSKNYNMGGGGGGGAPQIATLNPNMAAAGSGGLTLTVNGSNFGTDAVVYWNGNARSTMYITNKQVMASITASDVATSGTPPVYVLSGGQKSNIVNFDVQ
jgi:hypothetical protein